MQLRREIEGYGSELIALRREFHEHPELGYKEYHTSKLIYDYLKALRVFEVENITKTGIVGTIYGQPAFGKTVLFRVNMDALPIIEENDVSYRSKSTGIMHASGHDAQMAIALVVAKLLKKHRYEFAGAVRIVFQPNEERTGALDMINDGILRSPRADCALAMNFTQLLDSGIVGLSKGIVLGNTEEFRIKIIGKSGNTFFPHKSKDAALCAAKIIESVMLLESREYDPFMPLSIMFGKVHGGGARNVVIDEMELEGTIRFISTSDENSVYKIKNAFARIVKSVCSMMETEYELEFIHSNSELKNDELLVEELTRCARLTYMRADNIVEYKSLMGEDFAEFSSRIPSVMTFFGTNNAEKECVYPNYHPKFNIDEDILTDATEYFFRAITELLRR